MPMRTMPATRIPLVLTCFSVGLTACDRAAVPVEARPAYAPRSTAVITAMSGNGAIGFSDTTYYGIDHQSFAFSVGVAVSGPYGWFDYIDSAFVKEDGNYPHLVAGPEWDGTAIVSFIQTSSTCVEFEGVGRLLNTNELLGFRVETCDNGSPGPGLDTFGIQVPQRLLTHGGVYRAGPMPLIRGEVTAGEWGPRLGL